MVYLFFFILSISNYNLFLSWYIFCLFSVFLDLVLFILLVCLLKYWLMILVNGLWRWIPRFHAVRPGGSLSGFPPVIARVWDEFTALLEGTDSGTGSLENLQRSRWINEKRQGSLHRAETPVDEQLLACSERVFLFSAQTSSSHLASPVIISWKNGSSLMVGNKQDTDGRLSGFGATLSAVLAAWHLENLVIYPLMEGHEKAISSQGNWVHIQTPSGYSWGSFPDSSAQSAQGHSICLLSVFCLRYIVITPSIWIMSISPCNWMGFCCAVFQDYVHDHKNVYYLLMVCVPLWLPSASSLLLLIFFREFFKK